MLASDINRVVDESARKLLQSSSPSVRYWALVDIVHKDREDHAVQRVLDECKTYPLMLRQMKSIQPDGTWQIPESQKRLDPTGLHPPSYYVHTMMLKNLLSLLHFVCDHEGKSIGTSLDRLLKGQTREGYIKGPLGHPFPQTHYNGYALYILCGFDREYDPKVNRLAEWLYSTQRADGGWNMPYIQDVKYLPEYRDLGMDEFVAKMQADGRDIPRPKDLQDVPSCHWTTQMVLWGLNEQPWMRKDPRIRRGASFLLERFFKKNPHSNFYQNERSWMTAKYPFNKCSGLAALSVLTKIGIGAEDPRMEEPIRWLLSARYRDGLWTESDRPHTEAGQWLTMMALITLDRYAQTM